MLVLKWRLAIFSATLQGAFYLDGWNDLFFSQNVGQEGNILTLEGIKYANLRMATLYPQFVNAILQVVCVRTSQFVSDILKQQYLFYA